MRRWQVHRRVDLSPLSSHPGKARQTVEIAVRTIGVMVSQRLRAISPSIKLVHLLHQGILCFFPKRISWLFTGITCYRPLNTEGPYLASASRSLGSSSVRTCSRCEPLAIGLSIVAGKAQQLCGIIGKSFKQVWPLFEDVVDI